jgi:hypothetical protein
MNDVRRSGLKLFLVAGGLAAILGASALWLTGEGWQILGYGWGIPGAFALAGLVQVISGVPFSELASRWDALQGWQRGILGTIIFILAVGLIIGGLLVFARLMWGS